MIFHIQLAEQKPNHVFLIFQRDGDDISFSTAKAKTLTGFFHIYKTRNLYLTFNRKSRKIIPRFTYISKKKGSVISRPIGYW